MKLLLSFSWVLTCLIVYAVISREPLVWGDIIECYKHEDTSDFECDNCQLHASSGYYVKCSGGQVFQSSYCTEETDVDGWECEEFLGDCDGKLWVYPTLDDCMNNTNLISSETNGCTDNAGVVTFVYADSTSGGSSNCDGSIIW